MRYFTDELWEGINSQLRVQRDMAEKQWEENVNIYAEIFEKLKSRLSKKFLNIYTKENEFHDYTLKNIEVIHGPYGYKDPVKVIITIYNEDYEWEIIYINIYKISLEYNRINYNTRRQFKYGFDDYKYDEFLEINEKILSHEILFGSGATFLVQFEKISINKIKQK